MTAHTPGPWLYQATAGNHDFAIYQESTGRDVALVRDFSEANARLVAAAPDLLAALQLAHEALSEDAGYAQSTTAIRIRTALARLSE